ncbi:LOW QUALITY PROTEIN: IGF-like family receptor 1 [Gadus chalcogrammus]|uniref:LOW QUALITY PROTEIN: IGF-like family receptor 1 n=1 Tax=Gadus chalcogrammus TaxID=1042646 RepID=UPI0024C4E5C5|nr:LOW QUALITY PROTEIN: IGF-like family receptor 1 [Gadus chalcogrammus]
MSYSDVCTDLQTFYNLHTKQCVSCDMTWIKPGYEFVPNCGYADNGGRRDSHTQKCADNYWNDGKKWEMSNVFGLSDWGTNCGQCNATVDTCCGFGENVDPTRVSSTVDNRMEIRVTIIVLLACLMVGALTYFIYKRKKKSFQGLIADGNGNGAFLSQRDGQEWKAVLIPQVSAAPLRMVLDDLDVLEELIILLDPEGHGVKCTRHLASYCSFPSTWINYTYSMRDSKSPLKTLLEGVTTKYPEWTVGDLARLLGEMGRTDAIVVLAKLRPSVHTV